ncbi:MAG: hypothetical protein KDJ33_02505 [Gammaproteobacteria bacterium]|nr:hypothetical protein [Gammaproteobacteria bacterium]
MNLISSSNSMPTGILEKLVAFCSVRSKKTAREAYVIHVVEQVVDSIDPRMRGIARYAWKIRPAVVRMLDYAGEACSVVPGPIEFSRHAWSNDPCVRALFATATELQAAFSRTPDIAEYFKSPVPTHAYAVLGMQKTEKTTFGAEMYGEIIRRDVPQISVSFGDHRISDPAPDEQELRARIRERALNELIAQALFKVGELSNERDGIRKRRVALQVQLKALERRQAGLSQLLEDDAGLHEKIAATRQELARVEQECSSIRERFGTLSDLLRHVVELLSQPEQLVEVRPLTLCLDNMNRVVDPGEPNHEQRITLAQVNFGERFSRMGILAKFPRSEFAPATNQVDLDAAMRYLG